MLLKSLVFLVSIVPLFADITLDLDYSFDDFVRSYPLGVITLRHSFDGNYTGSFTSKTDKTFATKLKEHSEATYRVRAKSTRPSVTVTSFTKPCLILQSNLYHVFWVSVDHSTKSVQSVTVFPDTLAVDGTLVNTDKCADMTLTSAKEAHGSVYVQNKGSLPSPDTLSFVSKMEQERKARQHGADSDNRSFLAKYWMYILPVVVIMVISNAFNPEGGQGSE